MLLQLELNQNNRNLNKDEIKLKSDLTSSE